MRSSRRKEFVWGSWKWTPVPRRTRKWGKHNSYTTSPRKRVWRVVRIDPLWDSEMWSR